MAGVVGILFRIVLFASVFTISYVTVDIVNHGSLEASYTGRYLKENGWLIRVKPYYAKIEQQVIYFNKWMDKNVPVVKSTIIQSYRFAAKYVGIAVDLVKSQVGPEFFETIKKFTRLVLYYILEAFAVILNLISNIVQGVINFFEKSGFYEKDWVTVMRDGANGFSKEAQSYGSKVSKWISRKANCLLAA